MLIPFRIFNLEKLTDNELGRFSLGAVAFSRDGDRAVAMATNGRYAARVAWREDSRNEHPLDCEKAEHAEAILIDAKTCRNLAKVKVRAPKAILHNAAMVKADDNSVSIGVFDGEHTTQNTVRLVEGRFPNLADLIVDMKKRSRRQVVLDVKLVKTMLDSLDKVACCEKFTLTMAEHESDQHAVEFLAKSDDGVEFEGFVMPFAEQRPKSRRTAESNPAAVELPADPTTAAELAVAREEIARLTAERDADRAAWEAERSRWENELAQANRIREAQKRELTDLQSNSKLDVIAAKKELTEKLEAAAKENERLNAIRLAELAEYKADRKRFDQENGAMAGKLEAAERTIAKQRAELIAAVEAAKAAQAAKVAKPAEPAAPQVSAGFRVQGFRAGAGTGPQFLPAASTAASGWDAVYAYADGRVGAADIVVAAEGVSFRHR